MKTVEVEILKIIKFKVKICYKSKDILNIWIVQKSFYSLIRIKIYKFIEL